MNYIHDKQKINLGIIADKHKFISDYLQFIDNSV